MTKYLDYDGLGKVWGKMKTHVASADSTLKTTLEAEIAKKQDTLVSGTSIKTINKQSLLGSGDITIDLTLYKVVTALPTSDIDENKIYLVLSDESGTQNKYTEYVYVNSAWEKLGEYSASVDLTPYAKKADAVKSVTISGKTVTITMADGTTSTQTTQDTTYDVATTEKDGLMSSTDKTKLEGIAAGANKTVVDSALSSTSTNPVQNKVINTALAGKVDVVSGKGLSTNDYTTAEKTKLAGIEEGAEVNQNAFSKVVVGSTTVEADSKTASLTLVAGDNVTLTPDATNDKITIAAKDTTYSNATASAAGLMSAADYSKLAAVAENATADEALSDTDIDAICV